MVVGITLCVVVLFNPPATAHAALADTKNELRALHADVDVWRVEHANACPTLQQLKDDEGIAASSDIRDAWRNAPVIRCAGDESIIVSAGPDRRWATRDDIQFPESSK